MKKGRLAEGHHGVILHREERREPAKRVTRVHHDNSTFSEFHLGLLEMRDVDRPGQSFIGEAKVGLRILRALEQMFECPGRID